MHSELMLLEGTPQSNMIKMQGGAGQLQGGSQPRNGYDTDICVSNEVMNDAIAMNQLMNPMNE